MKNFSITKNGQPLNSGLYTWDEETRTLSTNESNLVLDFSTYSCCTFNTGSYCTFKTGSDCTFNTGSGCVIVRRNKFEYFSPEENKTYMLAPVNIPGYILDGYYYKNGIKQWLESEEE